MSACVKAETAAFMEVAEARAGSHVQLIAAKILRPRLVRRAAEKGGEILDRRDLSSLGAGRETEDRHVLDHAPAKRAPLGADGSIGHGSAPVLR